MSNRQTLLCRHNPCGPVDTLGRGQITPLQPPPPLPPPPPCQPSSNISLGATTCHRNRRYRPVGCTAPIVALLYRRRRSSTSTRRALLVILLVINIFFSSFNDVDPSHMMLVDCCVLCCRGCGPIVAV